MCPKSTRRLARVGALALAGVLSAMAQTAAVRNQAFRPDWRRIGNAAVDFSLAGPATGPVDRVWYSSDGATLFARTASGRVFATVDFESWTTRADAVPPADENFPTPFLPEANARIRLQSGNTVRLYAVGRNAWRSDDGGRSWANLTAYRQESILGAGLSDAAVSPRDPDDIVACGRFGVWRSLDGGLSWNGLNQGLPNLAVRKLLALPLGAGGVRVGIDGASEIEWAPGEKQAWRPATGSELAQEAEIKSALSQALKSPITAIGVSGSYVYGGGADGRLWSSPDRGGTWTAQAGAASAIESIFVDPKDQRVALAAGGRVFRTINGGLVWDEITTNLTGTPVHAVTADRTAGAVYAATDRGVFLTFLDLNALGPATAWAPLNGNLPSSPVRDVKLDPAGNQIFVALDGYGVYSAVAPHRFRDLRVVSAADLAVRPAAPGALLSVLGQKIRSARAGNLQVPVLDASETESQIQVPFEVKGSSLSLALEASAGKLTLGLPLESVAPAVFVDPDGTPFLLDADTGVRLDALTPARSNGRVQLLVTGLGRVEPGWPTGVPAPLENVPRVVAPVRAWLDKIPVEVSRATLAPGYIGFYLVEVQLPEVVNLGPAELYVESESRQSNRVRVYLEP